MEMTYLEAQIVELQTRKVLDRMRSTGSGGLCDGLMAVIGARALGEALRDTDEALDAAGARIEDLEDLCGDVLAAIRDMDLPSECMDQNLLDCLESASAGLEWSRIQPAEPAEQVEVPEAADEAPRDRRADGWDRLVAAVQAHDEKQKRPEDLRPPDADAELQCWCERGIQLLRTRLQAAGA